MAESIQNIEVCEQCPEGERKSAAETVCRTCAAYLCIKCLGLHVGRDMSVSHDVVSLKHDGAAVSDRRPCSPICGDHTGPCGDYCVYCNTPLCVICRESEAHKNHNVLKLLHAHNLVQSTDKDQGDLKSTIIPTYDAIIKELEVLNAKVIEDHLIKRTAIIQYGRELHRLIDRVIERYENEACQIEIEDLNFLGSEISKFKNTRSAMLMAYERNQNLKASKNSAKWLEHQFKNVHYITIPDRYDIKVSPFDPLALTPEKFCQIIGDLSPSVKTKIQGLTIYSPKVGMDSGEVQNTNEEGTEKSRGRNIPSTYTEKTSISITNLDSKVSRYDEGKVVVFLDVPKVLNIIKTGFRWTYKVECGHGTNHFYVSGSKSIIKHMDIKGILLDEIVTESKNIPRCFTVSKDGLLMYSDTVDRSINVVNNGKVKCIAKLGGWKPQTICSTCSGELLVALKADDVEEAKVVRYCSSKVKQEIQFDSSGQPLYCDPHYIDENKNLDIVVSDFDAKVVVVVDKIGNFRFTYKGIRSDKINDSFCPRGLTTDCLCHILVADFDNNLIHVIDQDGQFLRLIQNCGLHLPLDLSTNSDNSLFVVEYYSNRVKEIQYLI